MSTPNRFHLRALALPEEFAKVRRAALDWLEPRCEPTMSAEVVLCLNELLANVGRHAPSPECLVELTELTGTEDDGPALLLVLSDRGVTRPRLKEPDGRAECGRGLVLVNGLASSWGSELRPNGAEWAKDVWAAFRKAAPPCRT
ncbi:ATP-binding protein [Streptomyces sp. NPDC007088]|uniref:ATP-binding protein n=1 Tax=Streptomyces sp. NPDC007088 TaxID=3364773 RepID=UPI00369089F6